MSFVLRTRSASAATRRLTSWSAGARRRGAPGSCGRCRCRRAKLDGPAGRGSVSLPHPNRREHAAALRAGRFRAGLGRAAAQRSARAEAVGRAAGGAVDCAAAERAARGLLELVAATASALGGGVGHRGIAQPRDGALDTEKNGITGDKVEYCTG